MKKLVGQVVSVHAGANDDLSKPARAEIQVELDGVVGDRHQSYRRQTWAGDKQPQGTTRRNERQWSAVSAEELAEVSDDMNLSEQISAADLGANLCITSVPELSRLPKGTLLKFPSGAELVVEEYNPPCRDMGEQLAAKYVMQSGEPPSPTTFSKAAKLKRGIVGVVEVAGAIRCDDEVAVELYEPPGWLQRSTGL